MSLIKQLWLTILVLLLLAFGGSLAIGLSSLKQYTEQEMRIKNADNANALALSMSQLDKDPVTIELLLAAQFDTGHYRRVELRSPEGEVEIRREADERLADVPDWFVERVRFDIPAGEAVVQDGWQQYGTVVLESHHNYAYHTLWQNTQRLVAWFAVAALISAALAWWIVHSIRRPLRRVIDQARDIGNRRFTTSEAPRTLELRQVVTAMNLLSASVRDMLGQESEKLERLRRKLQQDEVSGADNRGHFLQQLERALDPDTGQGMGSLVIVRVARLSALNHTLGHQATNRLLADVASALKQLANVYGGGHVGRLNGSDFALLLPGDDDLEALARALKAKLHPLTDGASAPIGLPMALIAYTHSDARGELLSSLDGALARAEDDGDHAVGIASGAAHQSLFNNRDDWRRALDTALGEGLHLGHYPVLDADANPLHFESPSRLKIQGHWQPAGVFMPWISRLGMNVDFDLAVVKTALKQIDKDSKPLGINLSHQAARDSRFLSDIKPLLKQYPQAAAKLWLELPESVAVHHMESFRGLCRELQPFGCRLGLEHVGAEFSTLADLHDVGLAYLKIDASLVAGIDEQPDQQAILRGMATLAHSLGVLVIAEGVTQKNEAETLFELGLDGVTGPGVRKEPPQHNGD
ncbi:diguanylate cyclase/phosphodiesterase [Franzmannia pantelleriensis]|uniref:Diguanylate cyclase/phosphodiesterase n=1 Tax=Franzmannia pantelleriensis TaxID=48727 RepID=A0A1G9X783_9GAMM|nr:EAL domain-containing protein [Halomonas pantelleriensis]SDM92588.1 diguanylate cyclase/phosphodiesterase [Halomonas pantelleriensis]